VGVERDRLTAMPVPPSKLVRLARSIPDGKRPAARFKTLGGSLSL
jgi:hypothetical protein